MIFVLHRVFLFVFLPQERGRGGEISGRGRPAVEKENGGDKPPLREGNVPREESGDQGGARPGVRPQGELRCSFTTVHDI